MSDDTIHNLYRVPRIPNFDKLWEKYKDHPSTHVLNDIDFSDADYPEQLSELILSKASEVDFISTCECGNLSGNFYDGEICPKCHTPVTNEMNHNGGNYPIRTWIKAPEELKYGWISPVPYMWLERWTSYNGRSSKDRTKIQAYVRDLIDPTRPIPPFMEKWVTERIEATGTPRGFNFLYENFDRFIQSMIYEAPPTFIRKAMTSNLFKAIMLYKDEMWVKQFPILFNSLHAIIGSEGSVTNRKRYVDSTVRHVFQAASDLSQIEHRMDMNTISDKAYNSGVFRVYQNMMSYYNDIQLKHQSGKTGLPRKHLFGARHHLSARTLISPIAGEHYLDEIHLSWECSVNLFRPHLIGRLIYEFGMTPRDAYSKHHAALQTFDPDIYALLNRFIKESPFDRGVPILVCRNPSVHYLSVQLMFLGKVKTDPADKTMGISARNTSGFNADYDGDEMNLLVIPEVAAVPFFKNLHGSVNMIDRNTISVTGHFGVMKLDTIALNGYLGTI